ncbi:hypothetical protein, partial [Methanopyrus sp.]
EVISALKRYRPTTPRGWAEVQSTLSWFVEAARVGLWKPDRNTLKTIIRAWVEVTAKYGPSTCHHTSLNLSTVPFVRNVAVMLGMKDVLRKLPKVMNAYRTLDNPKIVAEMARMMARIISREVLRTNARNVPRSAAEVVSKASVRTPSERVRTAVRTLSEVLRRTMEAPSGTTSPSEIVQIVRASVSSGNSRGKALRGVPLSLTGAPLKEGRLSSGGSYGSVMASNLTHAISGAASGNVRRSTKGSKAEAKVMVRQRQTALAPRVIWEWVVGLLTASIVALLWAKRRLPVRKW